MYLALCFYVLRGWQSWHLCINQIAPQCKKQMAKYCVVFGESNYWHLWIGATSSHCGLHSTIKCYLMRPNMQHTHHILSYTRHWLIYTHTHMHLNSHQLFCSASSRGARMSRASPKWTHRELFTIIPYDRNPLIIITPDPFPHTQHTLQSNPFSAHHTCGRIMRLFSFSFFLFVFIDSR